MGKYCKNCGKEMESPKLTHCSDRCAFESINKSKPFGKPENPPDYSHS